MLELSGVDIFYGETQAVFDLSLGLERGEVIALLGPNGAGKTTTLRAILGLTPARRGRVSFDGIDITRMPTHTIARLGVGWVPDDRRLCPTLSVARNLSIAIKRSNFRAWTIKEVTEIFSALDYRGSRSGDAVGRRDADGRDRPRLARLAGTRPVRRAEPGTRAEGRARRAGDDQAAQGRGDFRDRRRAECRRRARGRRSRPDPGQWADRLDRSRRHASRGCALKQKLLGE